jgi:zinc protease
VNARKKEDSVSNFSAPLRALKKARQAIRQGCKVALKFSVGTCIFFALCLDLWAGQPAVWKYNLPGGLRLIVKRQIDTPLVAVAAVVKIGSKGEGRYAGSGIAHFVEHMIFKGTASLGPGQLQRKISSLGGTIQAHTSHDYTKFEIVLPSQNLTEALELLADCLKGPAFDPQEFERERQVILNEIRMNYDDPRRRVSKLLWSTAFEEHPYQYPIIGIESKFKELTVEDLISFHRQSYTAGNIILSVVGDVLPELLKSLVQDKFSGLPAEQMESSQGKALYSLEPPQKSKRQNLEIYEGSLIYLAIGFHSVSLLDRQLYPLDVLATTLGGALSSRLNQELVRKKGLIEELEVYNYTPGDPGLFIIACRLQPENLKSALDGISQELKKIRKKPPQEEELKIARNLVVSRYLFAGESVESQAAMLAIDEAIAGDFDFSSKYVEGIKSVDRETVSKVAEKFLNEDNLTIVALLPKKFRESIQEETLSLNLPRKAEIEQIVRHVLPNGLVVLLRENTRTPIVSVRVVFKGGLRAETESDNGISNLTARLFLRGTRKKRAFQLSRALESMGAEISVYSHNNSFGISLDLLKEDLGKGLELLFEILTEPAFKKEEIEREKQLIKSQIRTSQENVLSQGHLLLRQTLFKHHPYRFRSLGTEESISKITRRDIIKFWRTYVCPKNMVLGIFGDIDADEGISLVSRLFGRMKEAGQPHLQTPQEPQSQEKEEILEKMPKRESLVLVGFRGISIYDADRYAFDCLNTLLNESKVGLFQKIRQEQGLSYTAGTFFTTGIDPGYFAFYAFTDKSQIQKTKEIILRIIERLKSDYVDEQDLELAKNKLIGSHLAGLQTNGGFAFQSCLDELYGLGYLDYKKYTPSIKAVSKENIKDIANKYFDIAKTKIVVIEAEE